MSGIKRSTGSSDKTTIKKTGHLVGPPRRPGVKRKIHLVGPPERGTKTKGKTRIAAGDPSFFASHFDLCCELAENRSDYIGGEWIGLHGFPNYVYTIVRRIRTRVSSTSKPGLSPTIACAMSYGVRAIAANEDVQGLLALRHKLDTTESADADDVEELSGWFRNFTVGISDATMTGARRVNVTLPEELKLEVYELAGEMGTSYSALGILSVMLTLSTQSVVLTDSRDKLARAGDVFMRRVNRRRRVAEVLLDTLPK